MIRRFAGSAYGRTQLPRANNRCNDSKKVRQTKARLFYFALADDFCRSPKNRAAESISFVRKAFEKGNKRLLLPARQFFGKLHKFCRLLSVTYRVLIGAAIARIAIARPSQQLVGSHTEQIGKPDNRFEVGLTVARFPKLKILVMYECLFLI